MIAGAPSFLLARTLSRSVLPPLQALLQGGGTGTADFPGPTPWDGKALLGAALYGILFLVAVWGTWRLARDAAEDGTPDPGAANPVTPADPPEGSTDPPGDPA